MKLCYIDVETTGVDHMKHAIHQLSGLIEVNGYIEAEFNLKIRPWDGAEIDPMALTVSNVTEEQIMNNPMTYMEGYRTMMALLQKFVNKFDKKDKFFFVGYNSGFDNNFVRQMWSVCNDKYFGSMFWAGTIDVMVLALDYLKAERDQLPNFKLMTVAEYLTLSIDHDRLHDSMYDITLTRDLYQILKRN